MQCVPTINGGVPLCVDMFNDCRYNISKLTVYRVREDCFEGVVQEAGSYCGPGSHNQACFGELFRDGLGQSCGFLGSGHQEKRAEIARVRTDSGDCSDVATGLEYFE